MIWALLFVFLMYYWMGVTAIFMILAMGLLGFCYVAATGPSGPNDNY